MTTISDKVSVIGWSLVTFIALSLAAYSYGYRLNTSQSYPPGLYVIDAVKSNYQVNDRVLLCPPVHNSIKDAIRRGYLAPGYCDSGSVPMIKSIAAVSGDAVTLNDEVVIRDKALPGSTIQYHDSQGLALTPYRHHGKSRFWMPPGNVFVHSFYAPSDSFDSRYFGPVPTANILGTIKPVILLPDLQNLFAAQP